MTSKSEAVEFLFENPPELAIATADVLLRVANNVLQNPENPKYRTLRIANAIVSTKLLPVSGGMECLFEMGFEEDSENLTLPLGNSCLQRLRRTRDKLEAAKVRLQKKDSKPAEVPQAAAAASSSQMQGVNEPRSAQGAVGGGPSTFVFQQQQTFFSKLKSNFDHVMVYEDPNIQAKARSCIPVEDLTTKALHNLDNIKSRSASAVDVDKQDLFLLELLAWFKQHFFQWVDSPKCDNCGGNTEAVGMATPTPAEETFGASRVENFFCAKCQQHTRFPRYNHPGKLLETRRGRCGEWANCFTLCCRAVGLQTRHVVDWTDHVWTEVYSMSQRRWLHCDPCENKCDKPLIYEAGWGKKLSYVIAFAKDDIQDVTWRYSAKHSEVLSRRTQCSEQWLVDTIVKMRSSRQSSLGDERRKALRERTVRELVEFMSPRTAGIGEETGRESGSMAWRLARGETGGQSALTQPTVIRPTQGEIDAKCIHLQYCCATDEYLRVIEGNRVKGWDRLTNEMDHVIRKEELDWKMVYLARSEGSEESLISWKFDFADTGLVVDAVDMMAACRRFENGQVMWRVCGDTTCSFLPPDGARTHLKDLAGSKTMTLTAHMRGGKGDVAWQHTQLFRQELSQVAHYPLDIKITLRKT